MKGYIRYESDVLGAQAALDRHASGTEKVKGSISVDTSWDNGFMEARLNIDTNRALTYGMTQSQIAVQLPLAGGPVAVSGDLESMQSQFVGLYFKRSLDGNRD